MKILKKFKTAFFLAMCAFHFCPAAADAKLLEGDADEYIVTIKQIDLKNRAAEWVNLFKGSKEANLASLDDAFFMLENKGQFPSGTYVGIRIRISEEIRYAGDIGINKTQAGGKIVYGGSASSVHQLPGDLLDFKETGSTWTEDPKAKPGLAAMQFDLDFQDRDDIIEIRNKNDLKKDIVIGEYSQIYVDMRLQTRDVITMAWPFSLAPDYPKQNQMVLKHPVFTEIGLSADGVTSVCQGNQIEIEY